ncbi:MAG: PTS sugar transporter subunit IIB [Elusimicrobiota bacterium]|jgi:PTS system mannose-specific IIB component|nr:PTS sugar transporter subunit IIB [Elusimicrobiota bacterium]
MPIIFTRVDNRLIHGQVVEGWLPFVKPQEIVVISKEAAASALAKKMLRMSLPKNYALEVFAPEEGAQYLANNSAARQMLLLESIADLKELLEAGVTLKNVNIGNTNYARDKTPHNDSVFLTRQERALLQTLKETGAVVEFCALPSSISSRFYK